MPDWLKLLIEICAPIITLLTLIFGGGLWWKFREPIKEHKKKWANLSNEIKKQRCLIEDSGDFFGGLLYCHNIKSFNKKVPIYEKNDNGEHLLSMKELPQNYLIVGGAGDGKSTLVQRDFICSYKVGKKKCTLFFNVHNLSEIFKNGVKSYLNSIFNDIKCNEICLFIDGVDEIGEENLDNLSELITTINNYCVELSIKVSSRANFANKYGLKTLLNENIHHNITDIEFKEWDRTILLEIANDVIDKTRKNNIIDKKHTQILKQKIAKDIQGALGMILKNPLLLRLYLFIIINNANFDLSQISHEGTIKEYDLFNYFIDSFLERIRKYRNFLDNKIDISTRAFEAYRKRTKIITSKERKEEIPIFKPVAGKSVSFVHERFYEFFVAYYYKEALISLTTNNITDQCISALSNEYSNVYAAFITDAIRLESKETRDEISSKLIYLYRYTLSPDIDDKYAKECGQSEALNEMLMQDILSRSDHEMLFLKNEIVFRLARLQTSTKQTNKIIRILKFIYKNDNYTYNGANAQKDYWIAIQKRTCAISSSLLGGEEIECDCVKHMLNFAPYKRYYKSEYDLAYRSHTLIYYGDERQYGLLDFRDQPGHTWDNARENRLARLKLDPRPILQCNTSALDSDQRRLLKAYRFRLFDLAAIYCFLNSRKMEINEHKEVYSVIKNCIVDFDTTSGTKQVRCQMMKDIKDEIIYMFEK